MENNIDKKKEIYLNLICLTVHILDDVYVD